MSVTLIRLRSVMCGVTSDCIETLTLEKSVSLNLHSFGHNKITCAINGECGGS